MPRRSSRPGPWLAAAFLLTAAPAFGQLRQPETTPSQLPLQNAEQRSGLLWRFAPVKTDLPPDPRRDNRYDGTRWADNPRVDHPNCIKHGGMYGLRFKSACTACVPPYFQGYPGRSTLGPECTHCSPVFRIVQNIAQPFRPVGTYYDKGCFVPIYDLDPLVTGPGPYPWRVFCRKPTGG